MFLLMLFSDIWSFCRLREICTMADCYARALMLPCWLLIFYKVVPKSILYCNNPTECMHLTVFICYFIMTFVMSRK